MGIRGGSEEKEGDWSGNVQLKFGPGNAWMIARPRRKSLGDTQPSVTIYLDVSTKVR